MEAERAAIVADERQLKASEAAAEAAERCRTEIGKDLVTCMA